MAKIDVSALVGFAPEEYKGTGPTALLEKDGRYQNACIKCEAYQRDGKEGLNLALRIQDSDVPAGSTVYKRIYITGEDAKGKPNALHLGRMLLSFGRTLEEIDAFGKRGSVDTDDICRSLTNAENGKNICYTLIQQNEGNDGVIRSEVSFFIPKKEYDDSKQSGSGFRTTPNPGRRATARGGATTKANGATTSAAVTADIADAVASGM